MLQACRFPFSAMGSPCELHIYAENRAMAVRAADRVLADLRRIETRYSRYRDDSVTSGINRIAARGGCITADEETAGLLDYAETCHRESGGLFDITSGVLRRAWRFDSPTLPSETSIHLLLDKVGWDKLRWHRPHLQFEASGMEIDFGGIAKEYAADRSATLCLEQGIQHGLINLGGDIKVIGPHPDGSPWHIGIRHPRKEQGLMTTVVLSHGGLASSGDYERCIEIQGQRYSHILNPKTGWPVRHLAAVSVIADHCLVAGSLSTIAMLKEDEGVAWLADMGLPYVWMDVQGEMGGTLLSNHSL